jgi:hypothetical protein
MAIVLFLRFREKIYQHTVNLTNIGYNGDSKSPTAPWL